MKTIKLLLLLVLITTISSCTKNSDFTSPNPLANTSWKIKYSATLAGTHGKEINKSDFIHTMFNINDIGKVLTTKDYNLRTDLEPTRTSILKFDSTNPTTNIGSYSFSLKEGSKHCYEESEKYSYKELLIYNHLAYGNKHPYSEINHHFKLALNINKPNLLYLYYPHFGYKDPSNPKANMWTFFVYEPTQETLSTCTTVTPLPPGQELIGNWDIDLSFDNILQSKGKFIFDSSILTTDFGVSFYSIKGKFQEEINGQITEYPFISGSQYFPNFNSIGIDASNGTDTFSFSGKINADGKLVGLFGDNSVNLNSDYYGNFIATKK